MGTFVTKVFGKVELEDDGGFVKRKADANGHTTRPSLYVGEALKAAQLTRAAALIDTLEALDPKARKAIADDLGRADAGVTAAFIAFHLDELDAKTVTAIFGKAKVTPEQAITSLELSGVSVHDDDGDVSLVIDYIFGPGKTDQILAVEHDGKGKIIGVSHES